MGKEYLDLLKLSESMGVDVRYMTLPDGRVIGHAEWERANFDRAHEIILAKLKEGQEVYITGSPAPWITVALIESVKPYRLGYLYPDLNGTELDMAPLAFGTPKDNYDVQFVIREEDDRVLINMTSDRAEARQIGHHTFQVEHLSSVQIPEISSGKDILIHAWGMYCVMCNVALTYAASARSVYIACHDTDYICCYSSVPDQQIYDSRPRTWVNELPH